ncbi:MAG: hypothetical protein IJA69_03195, partial [Clostridia bacterium]|nr:hypothetical protein [Clostridia bacterium]
MKTKTKLISSIMSICLVCAVFAIGVFALKTANLKIGGDVTFNANGIEAVVTFKGLQNTNFDTTGKFQTVTLDNNTPGSVVYKTMESWQNL